MGRIYSTPGRRAHSRRAPPGAGSTWLTVRIALFTGVIVIACAARFSSAPPLMAARETLGAVVREDADYRGAVAALGRAVAGESDPGENAVLVFGRKILGLPDSAPDGDAALVSGGADVTVPAPTAPPTSAPPETTTTPETTAPIDGQEGGGDGLNPADARSADTQAGGNSGLRFEEGPFVAEAPLPDFVLSPNLGAGSDGAGDDTTPDGPFVIPSLDIVDDTVYTLPFDYAAPARGPVSSGFGYRVHPISGETTFHHGADLAVYTGTRVAAFADGTVSETGNHSVYGYYVKIDHGDGFQTLYAHLSEILVKKGKTVTLGDRIALSGNSGYSTGAHLHFEIRKDGKMLSPFNYVDFE
jgi:murein DD-endopeptidase MepM/ murein hydrolase activator NlpD